MPFNWWKLTLTFLNTTRLNLKSYATFWRHITGENKTLYYAGLFVGCLHVGDIEDTVRPSPLGQILFTFLSLEIIFIYWQKINNQSSFFLIGLQSTRAGRTERGTQGRRMRLWLPGVYRSNTRGQHIATNTRTSDDLWHMFRKTVFDVWPCNEHQVRMFAAADFEGRREHKNFLSKICTSLCPRLITGSLPKIGHQRDKTWAVRHPCHDNFLE